MKPLFEIDKSAYQDIRDLLASNGVQREDIRTMTQRDTYGTNTDRPMIVSLYVVTTDYRTLLFSFTPEMLEGQK